MKNTRIFDWEASPNQIHGAVNDGSEDVVFVSIYSAPQIGYEKASP